MNSSGCIGHTVQICRCSSERSVFGLPSLSPSTPSASVPKSDLPLFVLVLPGFLCTERFSAVLMGMKTSCPCSLQQGTLQTFVPLPVKSAKQQTVFPLSSRPQLLCPLIKVNFAESEQLVHALLNLSSFFSWVCATPSAVLDDPLMRATGLGIPRRRMLGWKCFAFFSWLCRLPLV